MRKSKRAHYLYISLFSLRFYFLAVDLVDIEISKYL
jgi:hypothetical protein